MADWVPAPFNLGSLLYVGFFGGPLAVGLIAWIQARRLRLGASVQRLLWVLTLAGVAGVGATVLAVSSVESFADLGTNLLFRRANNLWGLLGWMTVDRLLGGADRRYAVRDTNDAEPRSSLWMPGLAAVFLLGTAQQLVLRFALVPSLPMEAGP